MNHCHQYANLLHLFCSSQCHSHPFSCLPVHGQQLGAWQSLGSHIKAPITLLPSHDMADVASFQVPIWWAVLMDLFNGERWSLCHWKKVPQGDLWELHVVAPYKTSQANFLSAWITFTQPVKSGIVYLSSNDVVWEYILCVVWQLVPWLCCQWRCHRCTCNLWCYSCWPCMNTTWWH